MNVFAPVKRLIKFALEQKEYQYLYAQDDMLCFMDTENYEQIELQTEFVGERAAFLQDGYDGQGLRAMKALTSALNCRPKWCLKWLRLTQLLKAKRFHHLISQLLSKMACGLWCHRLLLLVKRSLLIPMKLTYVRRAES